MTETTIDIGKDFSKYPGGRVPADGPYNGERFREEFIAPALKQYDKVTIKIDGVKGYGSSFLEECYGGLVRAGFDVEFLKKKLNLEYENPIYEGYKDEIWEYIEDQVDA